jgi:hypothetical protein
MTGNIEAARRAAFEVVQQHREQEQEQERAPAQAKSKGPVRASSIEPKA